MINKLRLAIRNDLEVPAEQRVFGTGWLSGVGAIAAGLAGYYCYSVLNTPCSFQ